MNFHNLWAFAAGPILGWLGGWLHHALYIKPRQLLVKTKLPAILQVPLQNALNAAVPQLAQAAQTIADNAIQSAANSIMKP